MKFIILLSIMMAICRGYVTYRLDRTAQLQSFTGVDDWIKEQHNLDQEAQWQEAKYCNRGHYATGFEMIEGRADYASFRLYCDDGEVIKGHEPNPPSPYVNRQCPVKDDQKSYITAFQANIKIHWVDNLHSPQFSFKFDRRVALESVRVLCSDDDKTIIEARRPADGTNWGLFPHCPARSAVCGYRQLRTSHDYDEALIELACCQTELELSKPVGYWTRLAGFGGGGDAEVTFTYGVTNHKQEDLTSEFHNEVTKAVSAGVSFEAFGIGGSAEVSLSSTASSTMASTMSQSVTTSTEQSITLSCPEDDAAMYQWVTRMNENVMTDSFDFDIKSKDIWCVSDDKLIPQCPFGFCADEDCQKCDPFN